jgi:hypothetical protein
MKRAIIITLTLVLIAVLIIGASPVLAAKPPQVITISNGFPSGMHFNLNIHGKNPETFTTPSSPPYDPPYGNSIFIPEYTAPYKPVTIECISNKNGGTELTVIDPYAMPSTYSESYGGGSTGFAYADDLAQFILPYKIQTETGVVNANGYYVYGRILGKPNNSSITEGDPSSIILTPDPVLSFDYTDPDGMEWALGLITRNGAYKATSAGFERFDTSSTSTSKGKGKSVGQNITDLFIWTGWVCDAESLDLDGDGEIDEDDLVLYNAVNDPDYATVDEWLTAMAAEDPTLARYYEDWWVFDIADIVAQSWGIENNGTKLLQIRFYPVATTTFTEEAHIVVQKAVTDYDGNPITETTTLFDFAASYRNNWQMASNQFCLSDGLPAGSYSVTELAEEGWNLTSIFIDDPTGNSPEPTGNTANIELDAGETVYVIFTNAQELILP